VQRRQDCVPDNGHSTDSTYFSNNPDYSRLIYYVAFSILTQYRFYSGADLESARGRRRPFRTFAPRSRETIVPPVHCSIMQRRLNPGAALRSDFQGRHIPRRWSWRPPITSVSKPWRVTYRARNRSATLVCAESGTVDAASDTRGTKEERASSVTPEARCW